jgi:hypothetical protein
MDEQTLKETLKQELEEVAEPLLREIIKSIESGSDGTQQILKDGLADFKGRISQIPTGDEAKVSERAVNALELRVKQLQALVEKLPSSPKASPGSQTNLGPELQALKREVSAARKAAERAGQRSKGGKFGVSRQMLGWVGFVMLVGMVLGFLLNGWWTRPNLEDDRTYQIGRDMLMVYGPMGRDSRNLLTTWLRIEGDERREPAKMLLHNLEALSPPLDDMDKIIKELRAQEARGRKAKKKSKAKARP